MKEKILIVEDQFVEADYLRLLLTKAGYEVCDLARSVEQALNIIARQAPNIVLLDIFLKDERTGIELAIELKQRNIPFVYLSANSNEEVLSQAKATQPYGFLVKPFREKDLLVTLEIARYRHEYSLESQFRKESVLQEQLAGILTGEGSWEQKLLALGGLIQPYFPFDFLGAGLNRLTDRSTALSFLRVGFDEYQTLGVNELSIVTQTSTHQLVQLCGMSRVDSRATIYDEQDVYEADSTMAFKQTVFKTFGMQSHLTVPLRLFSGEVFTFCFYSRRPFAYDAEHVLLAGRLESHWARSLQEALSKVNATAAVSPALTNANVGHAFTNIVGRSHLLLNVLDHVSIVGPSDTAVLILGESGTGKEGIADAVHTLSARHRKAFVKVNCAALPLTLIESELFGHEKGSFTGATERRIGKFEQADGGTIFLDEVGELPLEFQVKLLRVLQEKEVERIGSRTAIKVDVRIIAATNRNLEKEVAEGRFRLDLYYRLNVFPIVLSPLRQRAEDIPALTSYFIARYNQKSGKRITGFSEKAFQKLMNYGWPGNIRELEHLIERSILLAPGLVIDDVALPQAGSPHAATVDDTRIKTIHEMERDHILAVLKKCNGKVWGPGAAAEMLNIPPSTLKSKMKKLGIRREYID
ncbi:sigma 54-interacting transcriptional regulator [Chryseolinea lacunae]|uniref:Sigma 54-interacting transcriptional regulator n=1 Tax=Chryseolinea lacunae TaxID=2801331 RepID=A0ABS1KK92_9BACT|nr:sigma 54-interacting transcriptional regulator [Chryseolinea lacunae]MBL0739869.1 sigma 54-interacting transcriptional regulator [Chryseolinea lacunae]